MAPRMKTRERIVQNSLELFNQQGERSVSTNHIAAHGNLARQPVLPLPQQAGDHRRVVQPV
jgi:hypothetical protein